MSMSNFTRKFLESKEALFQTYDLAKNLIDGAQDDFLERLKFNVAISKADEIHDFLMTDHEFLDDNDKMAVICSYIELRMEEDGESDLFKVLSEVLGG